MEEKYIDIRIKFVENEEDGYIYYYPTGISLQSTNIGQDALTIIGEEFGQIDGHQLMLMEIPETIYRGLDSSQ